MADTVYLLRPAQHWLPAATCERLSLSDKLGRLGADVRSGDTALHHNVVRGPEVRIASDDERPNKEVWLKVELWHKVPLLADDTIIL